MQKASRIVTLDFLRLLGVLVIMVAHAGPPFWLSQLRNFGTPLLIVASALTYRAIYQTRPLPALPFYKKRLMKLLLPVWGFLLIFFPLIALAFHLRGEPFPFPPEKVWKSFLLFDGINFVWIFHVYLVLALFTPVVLWANKLPVRNAVYFSSLAILYLGYELMLGRVLPTIPKPDKLFYNFIVFAPLVYLLLYLYGVRLATVSNRMLLVISGISLVVFAYLAVGLYQEKGTFVPTQKFKYPPRLYYLSYAFFALHLIYLWTRNIKAFRPRFEAAIIWLSSNSLWVYLWHILAWYLWPDFKVPPASFPIFLLKLVYLFSFGIAMTAGQNWLVAKIRQRRQGRSHS